MPTRSAGDIYYGNRSTSIPAATATSSTRPIASGLEITRANHVAAPSFVRLQQDNLANPNPAWLIKAFEYSHPTLGERIEFANTYRPWEHGEPLVYESRISTEGMASTASRGRPGPARPGRARGGGVMWRRFLPPLPDRPLRIGFLHHPPYMQWGPDGLPAGLSVEVISEAARRVHLPLEWVYTNGDVEGPFRDGTIDLWPALTILPARRIYFSDPWLTADLYIVVRGGGPKPDLIHRSDWSRRPAGDGVGAPETIPARDEQALSRRPGARDGVLRRGSERRLPAADRRDAGAARIRRPGARRRLHNYVVDNEIKMAIGSRFETRAAADMLRQELDRMARDGTLGGMSARGPDYQASEILAIFELLEARARTRLLVGGIVALGAALAMTTWLLVALYTASRTTAREQAARSQLEDELRQSQKLEASAASPAASPTTSTTC